jgi:hypothetical protein
MFHKKMDLVKIKEKITLCPLFLGAHIQGKFTQTISLKALNYSHVQVFTAKADPFKRPLILLKELVKFKPKKWVYKKLDRILMHYRVDNLDEWGIFKAAEILPSRSGYRVNQYAISEQIVDLIFTKSNLLLCF